MSEISEHEFYRRKSLEEILSIGVDPYPAATVEINSSAREILEKYNDNPDAFKSVSIAGRLMSRRIMGNASFAELMDSSGRVQLYFKRDDIAPGEDKTAYNVLFKKCTDIGDIIHVKGFVFVTQMGEITLHVQEFTLLSKALKPLPIVKEKDGVVYDAFTDPEQRYRQRYIDLIVNPQVKQTFVYRSRMIHSMRSFLMEKGYLEVETPILQPIYGGAAARILIAGILQ